MYQTLEPLELFLGHRKPLEAFFDQYHTGTLMEKNIDMLMYAALMCLNGKWEKHIPKVLIIA
jgi:hypothetical protein